MKFDVCEWLGVVMKKSVRLGLIFFCASVWSLVAQTNVAPYIISEPQDRAANVGDSVTFTVVAGGSEPLSYVWQQESYVMYWETNASLTLRPYLHFNGLHFLVTVTNVAGSITSRKALLTLPTFPCISKPGGYWAIMGNSADIWPTTNSPYWYGLPVASQVVIPEPGHIGSYGSEGFAIFNRVTFGNGWAPFKPSPPPPGFGCFLNLNCSVCALCFPTNITLPMLPLDLPTGLSLVGSQYPREASFEDIVGRSPDPETRLYRYDGGWPLYPTNIEGTTFITYAFTSSSWNPSNPIVPFGEAVWVLQPPKISNPRFVSGQFQFETRTATFATLDVEYTDALDATSPWLLLTNIVGSGNITNVVDTTAINGFPHRYYRLKIKPLPW